MGRLVVILTLVVWGVNFGAIRRLSGSFDQRPSSFNRSRVAALERGRAGHLRSMWVEPLAFGDIDVVS